MSSASMESLLESFVESYWSYELIAAWIHQRLSIWLFW